MLGSLKFSSSHVWVRVEGSEAMLGLSEYLQDQMGELTSLELPDVGDVIHVTRRIGSADSEDSSTPIEARVSGEVLEVNGEVLENPDVVNSDPYGAGRLLRVPLKIGPTEPGSIPRMPASSSYSSRSNPSMPALARFQATIFILGGARRGACAVRLDAPEEVDELINEEEYAELTTEV